MLFRSPRKTPFATMDLDIDCCVSAFRGHTTCFQPAGSALKLQLRDLFLYLTQGSLRPRGLPHPHTGPPLSSTSSTFSSTVSSPPPTTGRVVCSWLFWFTRAASPLGSLSPCPLVQGVWHWTVFLSLFAYWQFLKNTILCLHN